MADIQASGGQWLPKHVPLYVPQGRPIVRTTNPKRPDWLDAIKRPLRIVARQQRELDDFMRAWKLDETECLRILLTNDLVKLSVAVPLLVFPGGEDEGMIADFCPVRFWRGRGGPIINIPACAVHSYKTDSGIVLPHFPIETNMLAETVIAIALHRHLDALNGAP